MHDLISYQPPHKIITAHSRSSYSGGAPGTSARDASPDSVIFSNFSHFSSSASASVDRYSSASDVLDRETSDMSLHLSVSARGPDLDPNNNNSSPLFRKKVEKAKAIIEYTNAELDCDKNQALDSARSSFSQALKDCQYRKSRSEILLRKAERKRPTSFDLNNQAINVTSYSPRLAMKGSVSKQVSRRFPAQMIEKPLALPWGRTPRLDSGVRQTVKFRKEQERPFFRVDSTAFPLSVSLKSKILSKDPPTKLSQYDTEACDFLRTHTASFRKFSKPFLCWVGISRYYTLDENCYPTFWDGNEEMYLFAFIRHSDPTKVRMGERQPVEREGITVIALISCLMRGDAGQERSVERDDDLLEETVARDISDVAVERPRRNEKGKGKSLVVIRGLVLYGSSVPSGVTKPSTVVPDFDSETMHRIHVPKWNVTNDFVLDDPYVCRDLTDRLAPPALFSQLREDTSGAHFGKKDRLEDKCSEKITLLSKRDGEIAHLMSLLSLKEPEAVEAIRLRGQLSAVEATDAAKGNKLMDLKERNFAPEGEKDALSEKVTTLESVAALKETELAFGEGVVISCFCVHFSSIAYSLRYKYSVLLVRTSHDLSPIRFSHFDSYDTIDIPFDLQSGAYGCILGTLFRSVQVLSGKLGYEFESRSFYRTHL
nr:hypothetical protein [Tanacetum cinerariifolium]